MEFSAADLRAPASRTGWCTIRNEHKLKRARTESIKMHQNLKMIVILGTVDQ